MPGCPPPPSLTPHPTHHSATHQDPTTLDLAPATVAAKAGVLARGAFNPMVLLGHIIVDGVAASSFNDWSVAERLVPTTLKPALPAFYHTLLSLHRLGYRVMGPQAWAALNERYDLTAAGARVSLARALFSAVLPSS